jgi:hypothetical protein
MNVSGSDCDDCQNRNNDRRLHNARFRYQSWIESIDYEANYNLDRNQLLRYAECTYIRKHENILRKHWDREKLPGYSTRASGMYSWVKVYYANRLMAPIYVKNQKQKSMTYLSSMTLDYYL